MNKTLTLSVALIATFSTIVNAKKSHNPFTNQLGKLSAHQVHSTPTTGKTTALASRLVSEGTNFYDGSSYRLSDSAKYVYSPNGLRGFYNDLWQDWDYDTLNYMRFTSGAFRPTDRLYNQYNSNNMPTLMVSETYDGTNWVIDDRSTITYDPNGNVTTFEYESNSGSGLEKQYKILATYNSGNQLISTTEQDWDGSMYADAYRTTYTYNSNGSTMQEIYETYDGIAWHTDSRSTYTYDGNGNQTEVLDEQYNAGIWEPSYRTTQIFDPANDMIESYSEYYTSGMWQTTNEAYYTYDGRHNAVTSEYRGFNGTTIEPYNFTTMSYNNYNQMLTSTSMQWNANTGQFELQQGDADQRYHYEEFAVSVNDVAKQQNGSMTLFPVPAANFINIKLDLEKPQGVFIVMQDMTGKVVKKWSEAAGKQYFKKLSTENIAPGNYLIKVMAGGKQYTQQVSIVK